MLSLRLKLIAQHGTLTGRQPAQMLLQQPILKPVSPRVELKIKFALTVRSMSTRAIILLQKLLLGQGLNLKPKKRLCILRRLDILKNFTARFYIKTRILMLGISF